MAEVINLFTRKKQVMGTPPEKVFTPTHFPLNKTPSPVSKDDVLASKDYSFREEWSVTVASYRKLGLDLKELERHEVVLTEIGKAVAVATAVKNDREASDYFAELLVQMASHQQLCIELKQIPEDFRGYVWGLDYQKIVNASAFAEYRLGSIIGRPLTRHIYF